MIVGKIDDYARFPFPGENIAKAVRFALQNDLPVLPEGKTSIVGDDVVLNRQSYFGKPIESCKIEGHQNYLDLQLVIKGKETIGYVDKRREGVRQTSPYDSEKDRTNYTGPLDGFVTLGPGYFVLLFPNDLHEACIKATDELIEKAVFKIRIDF